MCHGRYSKVLSKVVYAFLTLLTVFSLSSHSAAAQYYPTFGSSEIGAGYTGVTGVAVTNAPAHTQASQVLALVCADNGAYYAYSLNGTSYTNEGVIDNCYSAPTLTLWNGVPYAAMEGSNGDLHVWKGTLNGTTDLYTWTEVLDQNVGYGGLTVAPQMVVFGSYLHIIYGVSEIGSIKDALVDTYTSNGTTFTESAAGLGSLTYSAPTQVGLSVLNGVLYMTTQQNNSQRHLFYWHSTDGFTWSGSEDTALYTDSSLSMITYNNYLIMATKQDNSDNHLFLFSSPNGSTWYAENQGLLMDANGAAPAMCLFNGGVALAYIYNGEFYTAFAAS